MGKQHIPVLLSETLQYLADTPGERFIDGTVGDGGHAKAILDARPTSQLLALDADPISIERAKRTLAPYGDRVTFAHLNFVNLDRVPTEYPAFSQVSGILLDLGYSSAQIDDDTRGFTFSGGSGLDMRYGGESQRTLRAADVLNTYSASELAKILREYGEDRHAASIAQEIIRERQKQNFSRTEQLTSVVLRVYRRLGHAPKGIHPATKTFMALRIAVNDELTVLQQALPKAVALLAPEGRLAVISFHSLEDRIVKQFFQKESRDCICPPAFPVCRCGHRASLRILTKRVIRPTEEEVNNNPRSRSARLRVAQHQPNYTRSK